MVRESETKIAKGQGSRRTIYLKKELWDDSSFPFKPMEPLVVRIEGERLIIERPPKGKLAHGVTHHSAQV